MSNLPQKLHSTVLPFLALAVTVTSVQAQTGVGLSAKASTLGAGGEIVIGLSRHIDLRGGVNYMTLTVNRSFENIPYYITPRALSFTGLLDFHPFDNAFRLTGGYIANSNQAKFFAAPTSPITVGSTVYQPSDVGHLDGMLDWKRSAPYVGLGFGGRSTVAITFDVGLVLSGVPRVSLTGTTNLTGQAKQVFDQDVAQELATIRKDINDNAKYLKYYPVVSLGLQFWP